MLLLYRTRNKRSDPIGSDRKTLPKQADLQRIRSSGESHCSRTQRMVPVLHLKTEMFIAPDLGPAMKIKTMTPLAAILALGAHLGTAQAQQADDSFFVRDRYEGVTERAQPEFDPEPLRSGSWQLRPELEVGAGYTSNLFGTSENETDDFYGVLAPRLDTRSDWSRHELGFNLFARHTEYFDTGDESNTGFGAGADGRLDVNSRASITGGVRGEQFFERRTAISNLPDAIEPVEGNVIGANVGVNYEFGRVGLRGRLGIDSFDFKDVSLRSGGQADQDFRDSDEVTGTVRVAYAVERDWALFTEARLIDRSYDTPGVGMNSFNRDSQGTVLLVGTDFELPVLLRGEVAVGYQNFEFDDPRFDDVSGLSIDTRVQWFVSQLTTLTGQARRAVIDPGVIGSAGATETSVTVRADYELLRNWLIFGEAGVSNFKFENVNRDDDRFDLGVGTTYKLNKRAWLETAYRYSNQNSDTQEFTDNRVTVSLRLFP